MEFLEFEVLFGAVGEKMRRWNGEICFACV